MTESSVLAGKRDAVRAGLARVAIDLFARHGFETVTIEEIARAAGISPRTFFRYFPSKDDIVLELGSRLQDRLLAAFAERPEHEGAVEALHRAYVATSTVTGEERERVLRVGRVLTSSPALRSASYGRPWANGAPIVAQVAQRMAASPPDPRPRIIAAAMAAVATTEWHAWVNDDGIGDPAERIDAALTALEEGLRALEARATENPCLPLRGGADEGCGDVRPDRQGGGHHRREPRDRPGYRPLLRRRRGGGDDRVPQARRLPGYGR